jgi:hypothetical protein
MNCLVRGEIMKFSSFGTFAARREGERLGRNPRNGIEAIIDVSIWWVIAESRLALASLHPHSRSTFPY